MFFDSWYDLLRIFVVGVLAYAGLILLQRLSGKRTLSKMNAFDLIVTVALGSTLATILLSSDVSYSEGIAAFVVLIGLQFLVTWLSTRWKPLTKVVKSEPRLLLYRGKFLEDAMRDERVLPAEVRQAARSSGFASLDDIEAVVLETDGSLSIIGSTEKEQTALADVELPDKEIG